MPNSESSFQLVAILLGAHLRIVLFAIAMDFTYRAEDSGRRVFGRGRCTTALDKLMPQ